MQLESGNNKNNLARKTEKKKLQLLKSGNKERKLLQTLKS